MMKNGRFGAFPWKMLEFLGAFGLSGSIRGQYSGLDDVRLLGGHAGARDDDPGSLS